MKAPCNNLSAVSFSAFVATAAAGFQQSVLDNASSFQTCSLLDFQLPGRVFFPASDLYDSLARSYWAANQGELSPSCRVTPFDSTDLQQIMFLISRSDVSFAIKSGGHSVVANTSNIAGGVTIDLSLLNHVTVDSHSETVDVGTGATWKDVYQELDGTGFGVVGARTGSVGIGGYILGGGLSPWSGLGGWSYDTSEGFEVVLGNRT